MRKYREVPVAELEKLEQSRLALYKMLENNKELHPQLLEITQQIWRVANTKRWNNEIT